MATYQSELIFNCTPAQLETALLTTLPSAAMQVLRAPIQYQGLIRSNGTIAFTATTNSTTALTAVSSLAGLYVGMPVTGGGIQAGTTIATIGPGNVATLSLAATTSVTNNALTATPNLGQVDFFYDGLYYLKFFGANPVPTPMSTFVGVSRNQMTPQLITMLTTLFAATLGAPVQPNLANMPSNWRNA